MKGFVIFSVFAVLYVLIIILFQASAQEVPPPMVNHGQGPNGIPYPSSPTPGFNQQSNLTQGIVGWLQSLNWDVLGISTPAARQSINNVYGSMAGDLECQKKSFCILGNYLRNVPGRDLIFLVMSQYVPQDWGVLYDIFRISVMYGQNCELFICTPVQLSQGQPLGQPQVPFPSTPVPVMTAKNTTTSPLKEEDEELNEIHKNPKIQNKQFL